MRPSMPTMIINGGNDPYWTVDALNLYWNDLKSPRWVEIIPNAGHNLAQKKAESSADPTRVVNTLSAFGRCMVFDKKMPEVKFPA